MLGCMSSMILLPLAEALKKANPRLYLQALGLIELEGRSEVVSGEKYKDFDTCLPSMSIAREQGTFGKNPDCSGKQRLSAKIRSIITLLLRQIVGGRHLWKKFSRVFETSDIVHLHGLFIQQTHYYLSRKCPVPLVVSLWGSDVLRISDVRTTAIQQKILRKASAITVSGPEFREVVLAKYGRDLAPKIHDTYFNPGVADFVAGNREEASMRVRESRGISKSSIVVCIGHNGHPEGQHLELIRSLGDLNESMRDSLFVVVPMGYGGSPVYREKVEKALRDIGVAGTAIGEYLSDQELRDLRLATDILVYAPVSDAFSGSVSQALAAGAVAVLGSWLPYKARLRAGFAYHEIDCPAEAGAAVEMLLKDWPAARQRCAHNRNLSGEFFDPVRIGREWAKVYEKAAVRFEECRNA